jgi:hypothetical protein
MDVPKPPGFRPFPALEMAVPSKVPPRFPSQLNYQSIAIINSTIEGCRRRSPDSMISAFQKASLSLPVPVKGSNIVLVGDASPTDIEVFPMLSTGAIVQYVRFPWHGVSRKWPLRCMGPML